LLAKLSTATPVPSNGTNESEVGLEEPAADVVIEAEVADPAP
jgi:hypothetical protein